MGFTRSAPIVAGTVLVRSDIRSANYVAGSAGWIIEQDGDAEFNDVTVRGDLVATGDMNAYIEAKSQPVPQIIFQPPDYVTPPPTHAELAAGAIYVYNNPDNREIMSIEGPHFNLGGGAASDVYPQIAMGSPRYDGSVLSEIYMNPSDSSDNLTVHIEGDIDVTKALTVLGGLTVSGYVAATGPQIRLVQQVAQPLNNATNTSLMFTAGSQEIVTGNAATWHNPGGLNTRVIPDKPGIYAFSGTVIMAASGGGAYQQLVAAFFKNGARLNGANITRPDPTTASCSAVAFGSAFMNGTTDYIEFSAAQTNATASVQNTSGAGSLQSVFEVRQTSG